jgi:hypothetical protein
MPGLSNSPLDESKISLPPWLPWATTACLAALVACVGELWLIEKTRAQFLREQVLLSDAALKDSENQLEAETILEKREFADLRAATGSEGVPAVVLLRASEAGAARAWGVVIWDAEGKGALLRLSGLAAQADGHDYQLWLEGPGAGYPAACGTFHGAAAGEVTGIAVRLPMPYTAGCRFTLIDGKKGGAPTLDEARSGGSIVLATLP